MPRFFGPFSVRDRGCSETLGVVMAAHDGIEDLLVYPLGGHGVALLATHPELASKVENFARTGRRGEVIGGAARVQFSPRP